MRLRSGLLPRAHRWDLWSDDEGDEYHKEKVKRRGRKGYFDVLILFYSLTYTTYSNI
jgi:hypothetical protein